MKTSTFLKTAMAVGTIALFAPKANAQSTSYKILENDLDRYNFVAHANPFHINAYSPNITIGYNIKATYFPNRLIQLDLDFYKAYLDGDATGIYSPTGLTKAFNFQLGGALTFATYKKNSNNKVVLDSYSFGNYTHTTYIRVPAEIRRTFAVRAGIQEFYNNAHLSSIGNNSIKYYDKAGHATPAHDSITFEAMNYAINSFGVYAGIDVKTIRDVLINADGYGEKSNKGMNNFYFDVLLTPMVSYTLKPNTNQAGFNGVDINISENKKRYVGWRFGWQYTKFFNSGKFGYNAKTEIGQQPGTFYGSAFFLNFGFGLSFGTNIKVPFLQNLGMKKDKTTTPPAAK